MFIDWFSLVSSKHQVGNVMLLQFRKKDFREDAGIANRFDACCHAESIVMLLCKRQCLGDDFLYALLIEGKTDGIPGVQLGDVDDINLMVWISFHQLLSRLVGL